MGEGACRSGEGVVVWGEGACRGGGSSMEKGPVGQGRG